MRARYVAAIVAFVLITISPVAVKLATGELSIKPAAGPAGTVSGGGLSTTSSTLSPGTLLVGCGESHTGADYLIVCPAKAYVTSVGRIIRVNVTVKFAHPQPCPHSSWKIEVSNLKDAEIVGETSTKLINAYTAVKTYDVKVLGNGSVTITYYYGAGCPYGTEEVVKVSFFVVKELPALAGGQEVTSSTVAASPGTTAEATLNITGKLESVSVSGKYIDVNNRRVYVKGVWTCGSEEVKWKDLLTALSAEIGKVVSVAALNENDELVAVKITAGSTTCARGG